MVDLQNRQKTIKNEIKRGTVLLYNGTVKRYKADIGYKAYLENRQESRRKYRCLETASFLQYVDHHFHTDGWSPDACVGRAVMEGAFAKSQIVLPRFFASYCNLRTKKSYSGST